MDIKRTPDECFENLADFPFQPHYTNIPDGDDGTLRIHYIDEGPGDGPIVLLMHGQPSWAYLYRHMISPLVDAGCRVVAPDLVGFGRSDKPTRMDDYSYARHVTWMTDWLAAMDVSGITLFCQDWGSLIGLRLVAAFPERFSGVVLANGGLPTGMVPPEMSVHLKEAYKSLPVVQTAELGERFRDTTGLPGFLYWRKYCAESADLSPARVVAGSSVEPLSSEAIDAFAAPFPDQSYLAGARQFPSLVPLFHDEPGVEENKAAWEVLRQFDKPFMTAFSDKDPITAGGDKYFQKEVPGCRGVTHRTIQGAGHFLQNDQPGQCVEAILELMGRA